MSTRFGRYTLIEPLGAGGMAEVWRARMEGAEGFTRELVIKRIRKTLTEHADFARLFAREARLSARLHHANIVQVFEYGEVDDEPYLAMEFVEGLDLSRLMRARPGPLPAGIAAYIAREVGRALQCVHELSDENGQPLGLVHRDVSPSNIMLSIDGSVKLFDFGIARTAGESPLTDQGTFRGKISYSAPEVVEGAPHEARSDLFGLGVVLYELLTGRRLFTAPNDVQVLQRVHAANVPLLSSVDPTIPQTLEIVCHRLLARLPGDRYETAQAFVDAIDPVVLDLQTGARQLAALVGELRQRTPHTIQRPELPREVLTRPAIQPVAVPVEFTPPIARRNKLWRALSIGAVLGVVLVGAALTLTYTTKAEPRAVEPAPIAAQPPVELPSTTVAVHAAEPDDVDAGSGSFVEVRSVPPGALVKTLQGQLLGSTPWRMQRPVPAKVVLERAGFAPTAVLLEQGQAVFEVRLKPRTKKQSQNRAEPDIKAGQVVDPFSTAQ